MPNPKVRTLTIGGVTYDLQDNTSGYITGIINKPFGKSFCGAFNRL